MNGLCHVCDETNDKAKNDIIYYFPLFDRIRKIVRSDLRKMLNYSNMRKPTGENMFEDVFDGENYKWFESQMNRDRYFV